MSSGNTVPTFMLPYILLLWICHWNQPTRARHHLLLWSSYPGQRHLPRHELQLPQHDHWKEALSHISARIGCNARTEPSYTSVGVAAVGRQGARADIEVTLPAPHGPTLLDISLIHPRCPTYVAAASQTRGTAAALRDRDKYRVRAGHLHPGHTFVPASVETYGHGHLGRPIMRHLRTLSDVASRSLAVTRGSFLASAHRELSVALVQSQGYVYHSCVLLLANAFGVAGVAWRGDSLP
jgi:hypothetical protein